MANNQDDELIERGLDRLELMYGEGDDGQDMFFDEDDEEWEAAVEPTTQLVIEASTVFPCISGERMSHDFQNHLIAGTGWPVPGSFESFASYLAGWLEGNAEEIARSYLNMIRESE